MGGLAPIPTHLLFLSHPSICSHIKLLSTRSVLSFTPNFLVPLSFPRMSHNIHNLNLGQGARSNTNTLPSLHSLNLPPSHSQRPPPIQIYRPTNPPPLAVPRLHRTDTAAQQHSQPSFNPSLHPSLPPQATRHHDNQPANLSLPAPHHRLYSHDEAINASVSQRLDSGQPQTFPAIIPGYKGNHFVSG